MRKDEYLEVKHLASNNRNQILESKKYGCFYCLGIFPPGTIERWADGDNSEQDKTALCPYCNKDSVIGDATGYPVNIHFMHNMYMACYRDIILG